MRVIAGEARGRRLEALPGTDVTRPTLSQVKEAMFSIVQFDLPGARVLDLYAGSGQLGSLICMIMAVYSGHKMISGNKRTRKQVENTKAEE